MGLVGEQCPGVLDDFGYRRQLEKLREERRYFTDLLEDSNLKISDAWMVTAKRILELATNAKTLWKQGTPQEQLDYLNKICSNSVLDGPSIRYDLRKPFKTIAKMAVSDNWRSRAAQYRTWFIQSPQININNIHKLLVA